MRDTKGLSIRQVAAVSAILVVLAAVLAPAITDSVLQMQWKTCAGNMGVLSRAFLMYVNDNNGRFPQGGDLGSLNSGYRTVPDPNKPGSYLKMPVPSGDWVWFDGMWMGTGPFLWNNPSQPWSWKMNPSKGSIWPYTDRRPETYMCPADINAADPHSTTRGPFGLSYSMNHNILMAAYGDTGSYYSIPALITELADPSATVLLAEGWYGGTHNAWKGFTHSGPTFDGVFRWWQAATCARHWGGANFSFCDGHVGWVTASDQRGLSYFRDGRVANPQWFSCPATPSSP